LKKESWLIIHSALFLLGVKMEKIENWLDSRIGLNFRTGLGRMEQAIRLLGHPEKAYPTIHVTGIKVTKSQVTLLSGVIERLTIEKIVPTVNKVTTRIHKSLLISPK